MLHWGSNSSQSCTPGPRGLQSGRAEARAASAAGANPGWHACANARRAMALRGGAGCSKRPRSAPTGAPTSAQRAQRQQGAQEDCLMTPGSHGGRVHPARRGGLLCLFACCDDALLTLARGPQAAPRMKYRLRRRGASSGKGCRPRTGPLTAADADADAGRHRSCMPPAVVTCIGSG